MGGVGVDVGCADGLMEINVSYRQVCVTLHAVLHCLPVKEALSMEMERKTRGKLSSLSTHSIDKCAVALRCAEKANGSVGL